MSDDDKTFGCCMVALFGSITLAIVAVCTIAYNQDPPSPPPPVTIEVSTLDKVQGKWQVLQVVGPDGNAFEARDLFMDIKDNIAFQNDTQLRLEFISENVLKLYAKMESGEEKMVGEVKVTITTAEPIQMLWADKNNEKQETLFEIVKPE